MYDARANQIPQLHGQMYGGHVDPYAGYPHPGHAGVQYPQGVYSNHPGVPQAGTVQNPEIMEAFHRNLRQYSYGNGTQDYYSMAGGAPSYAYQGGYMQTPMYYQDPYGNPVAYPGYGQMSYPPQTTPPGSNTEVTHTSSDPRNLQTQPQGYYMPSHPSNINETGR